eukprot:TRINITY_DN67761_c0_g1_i1.p1 TRINITY_DN67761_c0_g1~~TRINITY_DN67761_c0_g1_i1.p1  ORF type:complete len:353 (+),score=41.05 TRINITY_DN67761_c0_g1_i1:77-1135(+)
MISYGAHSGHAGPTTQTAFLGLERRLAFGDEKRMQKYRDVDVTAMKEAYDRGEVVVGRRRQNTTNNIVLRQRKTEVGKSKWQFPVRGDATSLVMGDPVRRDPLSAGDVIFGWAERPAPKFRERGRDFIRLNKWSQGQASTAADVSAFRSHHDIRLQAPPAVYLQAELAQHKYDPGVSVAKTRRRRLSPQRSANFDTIPQTEDESDGPKRQHVQAAGVLTNEKGYIPPGAKDLMTHRYELDWLRQQVYLQAKRDERRRKKEEIRELAKRVRAVPVESQDKKEEYTANFVMKRFRDVPSRLGANKHGDQKRDTYSRGAMRPGSAFHERPASPPSSFFEDVSQYDDKDGTPDDDE